MVRMRTRVSGRAPTIRRVASIPSSTGMRMSISTTSGLKQTARLAHGVFAIARFTNDDGVGLHVEDLAQPYANQHLIVCYQDPGHRTGSSARITTNPPPGGRVASKRPP